MCRQFYRHCRDCHELFPMPEPGMREPCRAFQKAQLINPHLKECPGDEIQVIRPLSGHGGKVCEPCRKKNRIEQRQRENAQKRARRAKLKRDKMTAGIGAGNVVWTAPRTWTPSVMDAQTVALHSPQPRRFNTFNVRSTTQAIEYGLNGNIGKATVASDHINVSQDECGVYSRSRQVFATTMSNVLPSQGKGVDMIENEMYNGTNIHQQYEGESQDLSAKMPCVPLYEEHKEEPIGLGITLGNDAKWDQSHTETCSFNEWSFRMELNEWSTVFDDNDDPSGC